MDANINFFFQPNPEPKFWKKTPSAVAEQIAAYSSQFNEVFMFESSKSASVKEKGVIVAGNILGITRVRRPNCSLNFPIETRRDTCLQAYRN